MTENKQSLEIAGRQYDPSDYGSASFLGAALAETHEQVSDAYMEGTVEAAVDRENGPDIPLSQPE
ncbi:hypothetical protein GS3922_09360 [Geobacillus subterraneus]|uniref:DUF4025 domain-containing protein n=2 Tax=Geobacillus TaxID=129337 RepID=A0ABM6AC20_9BACL|nr:MULTISPECIES: YozQ family protein [Geobacillus]WJQ01596.1 YozQ family protein [Geobacillus stearothermophilus]AMX83851.1 hypothetical protein GS3922_09360 [Geobacillus subterraneus]KZS26586.1 hypothetical protein A5418_06730 [Geobacillus subterraneus]OXB88058.1 hypothetical protein B9L21_09250 [Geobacillus uzenensis]WJQ04997.1 YozQ family protein [Geobacillus stearothermophilus]